MPIKLPQTPELAYDCFRTVVSVTLNGYDNYNISVYEIDKKELENKL